MSQSKQSKNNLQSIVISLLVIVFVGLLVQACTGESTNNNEPANSNLASQNTSSDPALQGGKIILGVTQEPDHLDPHMAISAGTKELLFNVYEGLFKLDPSGNFVPCLVDSYDLSPDGLSIELKLKDGVSFHSGQSLSTKDVTYSLKRAGGFLDVPCLNPALSELELEAIDDLRLKITSKKYNPDLIANLSVGIIPADYKSDTNSYPSGTGPFKLASYQAQSHLDLVKFDKYHGQPAFLDQVKVLILADRDSATLDLHSGQIDIFPYLGPENIADLGELYNIVSGSANMVQLWAFNNQVEALNQAEIRKALNMGINREQIIDLVMNGHGQAIYSGLSPALKPYFADQLQDAYTYDPAKAKEIISKAYPDGLKLSCSVPVNYLIHVKTAEVIQAQLAELGVDLEIKRVDWLTWLDQVYANRNYETTIIALTFDEFTPRCVLERYASQSEHNFINFKSADYDKTLNTAISSTDDEARAQSYRELQRILLEQDASAFIQDPASLTAVRKYLAGYTQYPAYVQDLSLVYFTDPTALAESLQKFGE